MASADLGACEWFVWDLHRSNLIDRGQLDQIVGEFLKKQPRAEPPELAQYLVDHDVLTQFQAERLLQGKTQNLVLGPYVLMDVLGSGSMGSVYKALNKNDNKWYALKVLPRRSMWNVRIARRQVRAFEQCQHPSVVPFVDVGTSGSTHYLSWPFVDGVTLENIVQQNGKLDPGLVVHYALQAAEGLDICHQHSLIHGLLKPSNLMVTPDNQLRILDFGIGTLLTESEGESLVDTMSTANSLTSGLDCTSPESIMEPTNRTPAGDQYSLGCVIYYCLTGSYPFPEGSAVDKMMAHQTKQPAPIQELAPDVPEELSAIVDRLMQKAPEARFSRSNDVVLSLQPLAESMPMPRTRPAVAAAPRTDARPLAAVSAPDPLSAENGKSAPAKAPPGKSTAPAVKTAPAEPARDAPARGMVPPPTRPVPPPTRPGPVLPTRESFRRSGSQPPPPPVAEETAQDSSGFAGDEPKPVRRSLEERIGTAGILVLAAVIAAATWLLMNKFLPK